MAWRISTNPHEWTLNYSELVTKIEAFARAGIIYFTVKDIGESEESRLNRLLLQTRDERDKAFAKVRALEQAAKPKPKPKPKSKNK